MQDNITIKGLRVTANVGVGADERKIAQALKVDICMFPKKGLLNLKDDIKGTINYFEVSNAIRELANNGEWKLIETLAETIIDFVIQKYSLNKASVTIKKYILHDTEYVSVTITTN